MSYRKESEDHFSSLSQFAAADSSLDELVFQASQFLLNSRSYDVVRIELHGVKPIRFHFSSLTQEDIFREPLLLSNGRLTIGENGVTTPIFLSSESPGEAPRTDLDLAAAIPVWASGMVKGCLICGKVGDELEWSEGEKLELQQIASLFADKLVPSLSAAGSDLCEYAPRLLEQLGVPAIAVFPKSDSCFLTQEASEYVGLRHLVGKRFSVERLVRGIAEADRERVSSLIKGGSHPEHIRFSFALDDELRTVSARIERLGPEMVIIRIHAADREQKKRAPGSHVLDEDLSRILTHGKLVIIRTDPDFRITDFVGEAKALLGVSSEELLGDSNGWSQFLDPRDLRRLLLRLRRFGKEPREFSEEIRILDRTGSGEVRWFLLRSVPRIDSNGQLIGWEGLAVDITERRLIEDQLRKQRERIDTLYQVSRSLQVKLDPALVTLKGLKALVRTLHCSGGLGCFYDSADDRIEIVAAEGLSPRYVEELTKAIDKKSLVRHAVTTKEGLLVSNIQEDERANPELARIDDLRSTIVMPIMFEERVLGALVLFSKETGRFSADDRQLVSAAANQIGLAARQAEFYTQEREQADSLAVLYQLNHEFSRLFTTHEIAQHTLSILQQHFACRRGWFGVLNPAGTHIVGQGGFGPGVRTQLQTVQIEIGLRHDFLDEAIRTKDPVVVPAGTEMECSGLNRLLYRLRLGTFVILPLVSLGEVMGVCAIEPVVASKDYIRKKLPLLTSISMEIAACLAARRLEQRVAEADKMRMATVLGAGVAHNFNNLLQAVMGQASLIEMQLEPGSSLHESAHTIVEAASRGAALVKHLLSFSSVGPIEKEKLDAGKLLNESHDLYASILGGNISLRIDAPAEALEIEVDYGQFQQMVSNVLVNAREAIEESADGFVRIVIAHVRLRSSEIDPELAPGSYVRIDVEDNGRGMDDEELQRCFEPFYSRKQRDASTGLSLTGSGLGLSTAYSWAKQQGGILTASSTVGGGAVISLFLPRVENELSEHQESFSRTRPSAARALLVSFEDSVSQSLQGYLRTLGLGCEYVGSVAEAEERLRNAREGVSVLFVDLDQLGTEGLNALLDFEQRFPTLPLIALSGSRERWFEQVRGASHLRLLEKPLRLRSIQTELRQLLPEFPKENLSSKVEVITSRSHRESLEGIPDGDLDEIESAEKKHS